jgi:hypothetical protein
MSRNMPLLNKLQLYAQLTKCERLFDLSMDTSQRLSVERHRGVESMNRHKGGKGVKAGPS